MTADNDALRSAIGGVLFNVMNFPEVVQARLLGQDMTPLTAKLTEAVLASDWLREIMAAAKAEVVAQVDIELQRQTVYRDPYKGHPATTKKQKHYGQGFRSGLADAFTRFRRIYAEHVDGDVVNDAAQRILDSETKEQA